MKRVEQLQKFLSETKSECSQVWRTYDKLARQRGAAQALIDAFGSDSAALEAFLEDVINGKKTF